MADLATDRGTVERYFQAMQAGRAGVESLLALFTDDADYVEPFMGTVRTHHGKEAIREFFRQGHEQGMPEMTVSLDRLDVDGDRLRSEWTCTSPAWPSEMRGWDLYTIRDAKITRIEINVTTMPPMGQPPGR